MTAADVGSSIVRGASLTVDSPQNPREAGRLRPTLHAGTEHLLLALARVTDGLAAEVLRDVGLDEQAIRKRLARASCRCSFCEREGTEVAHLAAGPGVFICERCVDDAGDLGAQRPVTTPSSPLKLLTDQGATCSFCGKDSAQVAHLVAGPHALICDECVALCREIQEQEGSRRATE